MNRRLGAVAIVLMALTALAAVCSFVFFSKQDPQNSVAQSQTVASSSSSSSETSSSSSNPTPTSTTPGILRADQPAEFKPTAFVRDPSWRLLDWSVKPLPEKPGVKLRASSWAAPGKHSFVRVEEQIRPDASGKIQVLHIKEMVGDQIIVKLPEGSSQENAEAMASKIGARAGSRPFAPDTWLFKLEQKLEAVPEGMENLKSSGAVIDYTEPDLIVRPARLPNDPKVTDFTSWHLYNNTQTDKDIRAAKAWDRRTSAAYGTTNKVIVAVLDSGVRYSHQDLSVNMWRNPGEIAGDGIDNDNNGWKDDIYGIDAADSDDWTDSDNDAKKDTLESPFGSLNLDSDPMDTDGHGTHCAGLIGAVGNNGIGLAGVAWAGVEIMALRFIDGTGSVSDEVLCMDYARLRGAKVINASFGQDGGESSTERNAINRLNSSGVILVAAAGNGGSDRIGDDNNGDKPFYPASYTSANIIAVGATDRNDNKATFSNYGTTAVDLFAPGTESFSTRTGSDTSYTTGDLKQFEGTSFAAPIVSGALALLIAEYPNDSVSTRRGRIVSTNAVDVIPALSGLCATGGRLNLAKLLPANTNPLAVANAWHLPFNLETQISSTMRNPTNNLTPTGAITLYSGVQKFNNPDYGMANQTGGAVLYRTSVATAWITNTFRTNPVVNSGNNQYWSSVLSNLPAGTIQYVLRLDFDSGAQTTYAYAQTSSSSATTTNLTTAQASPFSFTVAKSPATVTLSGTNQTYNGSARPVTAATTPSGLTTSITYNGSSSAPTNAGSYNVVATVTDSNHEGSATNTLTVAPASASVSLSGLSQTYDGISRTVTATTSPTNLPVTITYNGASTAPTNAGTYTVVATVNDDNYQGSTTNTLTVNKASATVTLGNLSQTYDGSTKSASATTSPPGLINDLTYDGGISAPVNAGTYAVIATVNDANYSGTASGSLQVAKGVASVSLSGLNQNYDGTPRTVSVSTSPSGLATSVLYAGSPTAPTEPGTYSVIATVTDANREGSAGGILQIAGLANPQGDSDGDGLENLLEYALAEAPVNPALSGSPIALTTASLDPAGSGAKELVLTAVVRTNDPSLTYLPKISLNLGGAEGWTGDGINPVDAEDQTGVPVGFVRREYRFDPGTNTRSFLKLTIQQQ